MSGAAARTGGFKGKRKENSEIKVGGKNVYKN